MHATATGPTLRMPGVHVGRTVRKPSGFAGDSLAFVIGATCSIRIHLIGDLPLGEVFLVLALPFLCVKYWRRISDPRNRVIFWLMGLWLASQIISDMVNNSPHDSRLKGMARVIFFLFDFMGFSALIGSNTRRLVVLVFALAVDELVWSQTFGLGMSGTGWKFGGSMGATILVMLVGSYLCARRRYGIYVLLVAGVAAANLHFGYRSQIAVDLVALVFTLPIFLGVGGRGAQEKNSILRVSVLLICCFGALWLSQKIVHEAVQRGYFQEGLEQKFEQQSQGKLGVLVGGRPEIPVALQAIADRPILGHGSYAVDPKYLVLLQDYQYRYGYSESDEPEDVENPVIPAHSHILSMWVEGGILTSLFWFYLLGLIVRRVTMLAVWNPPLAPLCAFFWVSFFWDILFSPFGYDRRIYESLFIVLLIHVMAKAKTRPAPRGTARPRRRIYRGTPNRVLLPRLPLPNRGHHRATSAV